MWHTVSIWAFSWKYDVFVQVKRKRRDDFLTKVETSLQLKASNSTYPKTGHQKLVRLTRVRLSYYETNFDSSEVKLVLQRRASGGELSSVRDTRVFDLCVFDSDEWDCILQTAQCHRTVALPLIPICGLIVNLKFLRSSLFFTFMFLIRRYTTI